jgi:hypothetical protein
MTVETKKRELHRLYAEIQRKLRRKLPNLKIVVGWCHNAIAQHERHKTYSVIRMRKCLFNKDLVHYVCTSVFLHEVGHIIAGPTGFDMYSLKEDGMHGLEFQRAMRRLVDAGFFDRNLW